MNAPAYRDPRDRLPPGASITPEDGSRARAREHLAAYAAAPMRLRPLRDECLVALDQQPEETAGGVYLAPMVRDQPSTGTVVDVAPRCGFVEVGDRVAFGKWNGRKHEDVTCRAMGFAPGQLWVMRAVFVQRAGEEPIKHVGQDEIFGVIEEG